MAKGIELPISVTRRGGARLLEGTPYLEQVIRYGLTPNYSRNPFQAGGGVVVGVSERCVFGVPGPARAAAARREITRFFARLRAADLAKLGPGSEGLRVEFEGEELVAAIRYVDLEADEEGKLSTNLQDALRSEPHVNAGGR
jgi:hypothetical protein